MTHINQPNATVWVVGEMPDGTRVLSHSSSGADDDLVWIETAPEKTSTLASLDTAAGEAVIGWYAEPEPHAPAVRSDSSESVHEKRRAEPAVAFTKEGVEFGLELVEAGLKESERALYWAEKRVAAAQLAHDDASEAYAADPAAANLVRMKLITFEMESADAEVQRLRRKRAAQQDLHMKVKGRAPRDVRESTKPSEGPLDAPESEDIDPYVAYDGGPGFPARNGYRDYPAAKPRVVRGRSGGVFVLDGRHISGWNPEESLDGSPNGGTFQPMSGTTGASYDKYVGLVEAPPAETVAALAAYMANPPKYGPLPPGLIV